MNLYTDDELDLILHCINNTDTSRWDEEEAKKLRLLEAKIREASIKIGSAKERIRFALEKN